MVRAQGLALLFANVRAAGSTTMTRARPTLAALDRRLGRGQRFSTCSTALPHPEAAARSASGRGAPRSPRGRRDEDDDRVPA
jgi:hypothetical protein